MGTAGLDPSNPHAFGRMLDDLQETRVKPWEIRAFRNAVAGAWLLAAASLAPLLLPDWEAGCLIFGGAALLCGLTSLTCLVAHRLSLRGHAVLRRRLAESQKDETPGYAPEES
jgi:hypothetical protein